MKKFILLAIGLTSFAAQAHSPEGMPHPVAHELLHIAPLMLTLVLAGAFRKKIQERIKNRFYSA